MKKALDWFYVKLSDYHDLSYVYDVSLMSWHFSALKLSDQKLRALHHVVSCCVMYSCACIECTCVSLSVENGSHLQCDSALSCTLCLP